MTFMVTIAYRSYSRYPRYYEPIIKPSRIYRQRGGGLDLDEDGRIEPYIDFAPFYHLIGITWALN